MSLFDSFKHFIEASPTSTFCTHQIEKTLCEYAFKPWGKEPLEKGSRYYLKHEGFLMAFHLPKKLKNVRYLLSHTDSPCLKLKPKPLVTQHGLSFLRAETYGSPLLSSYLGHPLTVAGQVIVEDGTELKKQSVYLKKPIALIPDPAIHLSKESNASLDKGMLSALVDGAPIKSLEALLEIKGEILSHDLYLVSAKPLERYGHLEPLIAGPRLDNLISSYALLSALESLNDSSESLYIGIFFDHEEIGSMTLHGAHSHFVIQKLKELFDLYPEHASAVYEAYSLDVAHANHPSYNEKFDVDHPILLGKGLVIKHHSGHKYAQDLELFARCRKMGLAHQIFTMRNEVGTGSTLGPYFAALHGVPTQDIGIGILGMHSTTEVCSEKDLEILIQFCKRFFS